MKALLLKVALVFCTIGFLSACSPEVGSEEWCSDLKEKDKGDWSVNEAAEFTKNCLM